MQSARYGGLIEEAQQLLARLKAERDAAELARAAEERSRASEAVALARSRCEFREGILVERNWTALRSLYDAASHADLRGLPVGDEVRRLTEAFDEHFRDDY